MLAGRDTASLFNNPDDSAEMALAQRCLRHLCRRVFQPELFRSSSARRSGFRSNTQRAG
jgi:hypothetical protein